VSPRSHLYVPGNAPDRFGKAVASGAGAVILDLEDAVAVSAKDDARATVAEWVRRPRTEAVEVWVRVNTGARGTDDVRAVVGPGLTGICVPKVAAVSTLQLLHTLLSGLETAGGLPLGSIAVCPLIETAAGVVAAAEIAAGPRVRHLQLGEVDLAADLGVRPGPEGWELLHARSTVVTASAAAGIAPPPGPVSTEFRDLAAFTAETERLARLGFAGRVCIHPAQIRPVERVFTPTAEELAAARDVLDRLAHAASGVAVGPDGRLLDEALARQARRLLASA
jgi:citrate lyase subunit beta/citryl-CoA lyase